MSKNKNHSKEKEINAPPLKQVGVVNSVEEEKIVLPKRSMPFSKGRSFPLPARLRFQYFRTGA